MRVLLTDLPPLLSDVLGEALAVESDIELVDAAASADVVVLQAAREAAARIHRSLQPVVIAIDPEATHALVFERDKEPVVLADVSPTTIIMAIRGTGTSS